TDIDRRADVGGQRNQDLAPPAVPGSNDQPTPRQGPFHAADGSNDFPVGRLDAATDEVVPIERARRQFRELLRRYPQLTTGESLGLAHRVDAFDPDHWTLALKPHRRDPHRTDHAAALGEQLGAGTESRLRKIGFEIHDDLAANAMRPRDAPDYGHVVP